MDTVLSHGLIVQITPGSTTFQDNVTLYRFKQDEASATSHLQQSQSSRVSVSIETVAVCDSVSCLLRTDATQALDTAFSSGELAAAIRADEPDKVVSLVFSNEDQPSSEEEIVFLFHKCITVCRAVALDHGAKISAAQGREDHQCLRVVVPVCDQQRGFERRYAHAHVCRSHNAQSH